MVFRVISGTTICCDARRYFHNRVMYEVLLCLGELGNPSHMYRESCSVLHKILTLTLALRGLFFSLELGHLVDY